MLNFKYTGIYMALYLTFGINNMAIKTSRSSVFFHNLGNFLSCKINENIVVFKVCPYIRDMFSVSTCSFRHIVLSFSYLGINQECV